jgi:hypothetical protein
MNLKLAILLAASVFSGQLNAAEFPSGILKGTGFQVEKGSQVMTEKNLHVYNSSATVVKRKDGSYEFTIEAQLQKSPATPLMSDRRVDVFDVIWESATTGKLVNRNLTYRDDRTTFVIEPGKLLVKSWIARNQFWETHIYSIPK